MFEERTYNRTFYSAPQSVTSLVAAFVEPTIIVAAYIAISLQFDEPIERPALTLCLLVFALTFPGRNRFRENLIAAGVDIVGSWVTLLVILALCGYATFSLQFFDVHVLLAWAVVTPFLQWAVVWAGGRIVRAAATCSGVPVVTTWTAAAPTPMRSWRRSVTPSSSSEELASKTWASSSARSST